MTMMAFSIAGIGYGDYVSAGQMTIAFTMAGGHAVYRWIGTGCSPLYASARCRPLQVPYHGMLANFSGQDILFKLKGGVPLGGRSQVGFSIRYSSGNRAEVYNLAPSAPENLIGVDVIGTVLTDVEIFSPFRLIATGALGTSLSSHLFLPPAW